MKDGFKAKKEARAKYDKVLSQYIKEQKAHKDKKTEGEEKKPAGKTLAVVPKKVDPKATAATTKPDPKKASP